MKLTLYSGEVVHFEFDQNLVGLWVEDEETTWLDKRDVKNLIEKLKKVQKMLEKE